MIRFIFVCMALVMLSILTISGQYMLHGIKQAREDVASRNLVQAVEQDTTAVDASTGPSFEEIYASMPAPAAITESTNPEDLNAIETTAGGDEFSNGFTGVAPKALADEEPVPAPALDATALENSSN